MPVILILEDQEQRLEDLRFRIQRNVPRIAAFVILHNLKRQMAGRLIRFGLMGEAFKADELRAESLSRQCSALQKNISRRTSRTGKKGR